MKFLVSALAILACACGDESTSPTAPTPGVPSSVLRVSGPSWIEPGTTVQFKAIADRPDGTSSDVTHLVTWSSLRPGILTFDPGGMVQAVGRGETEVRATYESVSPAHGVIVRELGTHKLSGTIVDADTNGTIEDAVVEVIEGIGAGLTARADTKGRFELHGVAGSVRLRSSHEGYEGVMTTIDVPDSRAVVSITLSPVAAAASMNGVWALRFTEPPDCPGHSIDLLTREVGLSVAHSASRLFVLPSGPTVVPTDPLSGQIFGGHVVIRIPYWEDWFDGSGYGILEALGPTEFLGVGGLITGDLSPDGRRVTGVFDGLMSHYPIGQLGPGWLFGAWTTCTGRWRATIDRRE